MGRQLKRVALDFGWPLRKVWKGYINPHPYPRRCETCDGQGTNAATKQLSDEYYDHEGFGVTWRYDYGFDRDGKPATRPPWRIIGTSKSWMHDITEDEVDALMAADRLMDLTHTWTPGGGWVRRADNYRPTAAEVNEWSHHGFGHDAINQFILVKARARRLGVYGKCSDCRGRGEHKLPRKMKKRHNNWRNSEPPSGPGYQIWETVSEGSPTTPVFAEPGDLVAWLVEHEDYSVEAASRFVHGSGWAPSMMMAGGKLYRDIESTILQVDRSHDSD